MSEPVDTPLPDLTDMSLADLHHIPADALADIQADIRERAAAPRINLGSSGPPGRSD